MSASTTQKTSDHAIHLKIDGILLIIGKLSQDKQDLFADLGFRIFQIESTVKGLQTLQEIRANQENRNQLLVLGFHPEDLAGRHIWKEFWQQKEEIQGIPAILVTDKKAGDVVIWGSEWGVQEVFPGDMSAQAVHKRLNQMIDLQLLIAQKRDNLLQSTKYKTPVIKRIFDIVLAGTALLMLSPILLVVITIIKITSPGPIYYISKRVGSGYQVFDFYKLRSMRVNADKMVKDLMHLNQYASDSGEQEEEVIMVGDQMEFDELNPEMLISDENVVSEDSFRTKQRAKADNAFFKIEKDPRITKIGQFIRNTSIDELPQLINVLKGDMSIVGNRPLPLYEAEQLTTDEYTERFNAPAGITGLWQVTDRGKSGVSTDIRKRLDVEYARKYSIWLDFKILFMTAPALFQKSDV